MQEREVENELREAAIEAGGITMKFVSPGMAGVPDRIVVLPGGVVAFVELKAPGKTPRILQRVTLRNLYRLGAHTATVDNVKSARRLIRLLKERYAVPRP